MGYKPVEITFWDGTANHIIRRSEEEIEELKAHQARELKAARSRRDEAQF